MKDKQLNFKNREKTQFGNFNHQLQKKYKNSMDCYIS